jgi:hypothetical protein
MKALPNIVLHCIAAQWRFLLNVKGYSWAARSERLR